jgi:hypothetical protein
MMGASHTSQANWNNWNSQRACSDASRSTEARDQAAPDRIAALKDGRAEEVQATLLVPAPSPTVLNVSPWFRRRPRLTP